MVAYFRKQINLFMILGALLGIALGIVFYSQDSSTIPGYFKMFFILLPAFVGVILGRIYAGFWANKKLRKYNALLYTQVEPAKFLEVFTPIVRNAPKDNIAYVDGCNKLAYAHEALGQFEEAMAWVAPLKPETLKHHTLGGMAITCNQRMRLLLLQEKQDDARKTLQELRDIAEAAMSRAPSLGKNTNECVRLYENWLAVLDGQPADETYLLEEIQLSQNRIHKSEMQLLLARSYENQGDQLQADELRMDALTTGQGLWAESKARELLTNA